MGVLPSGPRKALLAGGIAVALTAGGTAAVWAGTQAGQPPSGTSSSTPVPSPSPSHAKPKASRGQALHGEHVVKDANGSFRTVVTQSGTIESVSGSEVTIRSEDGFTQRYAVNGDTKIVKAAPEMQGRGRGKPARPSATAAELKVGDTVHASGTKDGYTVTARRIVLAGLPAMSGGHQRGHGAK